MKAGGRSLEGTLVLLSVDVHQDGPRQRGVLVDNVRHLRVDVSQIAVEGASRWRDLYFIMPVC